MKLIKIFVVIFITIISVSSFAQGRSKNKLGVAINFVGDPFPSLVSYQLSYNLMHWLRAGVSYGKFNFASTDAGPDSASGSITSVGVSAKVFVLPSWNLSPFVGAGYSYGKGTGTFTIGGESLNSAENLTTIVGSVGIDHQSNIGFNIGAGINYFISPTLVTDALTYLPHFYVAWFF